MVVRDACPGCRSPQFKKHGHMHSGKQHHQCKACGRQCVASADDRIIAGEHRTRIEYRLRERMSLRGICRAVGVSLTWLLRCMVERFAACPDHSHVQPPAGPIDVVVQLLEAETDERWSFVAKKASKRWIWIAMDAKTRQVMAFHVGDRGRESGAPLWAKLPEVYQRQAVFHTDRYAVYKDVLPPERHKAMTKHARKTNHLERFKNTLRPRVSRLVREALSFSKKRAHHIGAIQYCICHDTLAKAAALPV